MKLILLILLLCTSVQAQIMYSGWEKVGDYIKLKVDSQCVIEGTDTTWITAHRIMIGSQHEDSTAATVYTAETLIGDSVILRALLTGTTFTGAVYFDDGSGDSPVMRWYNEDNNYFMIGKYDAGSAQLFNNEGAIEFQPSGDVNDYLRISTASNIVTLETVASGDGDLVIRAGGGDISFYDDVVTMKAWKWYTGGNSGGTYDSTDAPANGDQLTWSTGGGIDWQPAAGGAGEANTGSNVGNGTANIYKGMNGTVLEFYTLAQGTNITLTNEGDSVIITASGSGLTYFTEADDNDTSVFTATAPNTTIGFNDKVTMQGNNLIGVGVINAAGNLTLNDGFDNSPYMYWMDGDGKFFSIVKYDDGSARLLNDEGAIHFYPNNDVNDYLKISTATNVVTLETVASGDGDLVIRAGGGDISFHDDKVTMKTWTWYTGGNSGGTYDSTDAPANGDQLTWSTGGGIDWQPAAGGAGEANTLGDTGTFNGTEGFGLAGGKTGVVNKVKGVIEGSNITIAASGDSAYTITASGGSGPIDEIDGATRDTVRWIDPALDTSLVVSSDGSGNVWLGVGKESDNTAQTLRLKADSIDINGDVIADFAGTGLSVTSGVLNASASGLDHGDLSGLTDDDHTQYLKESDTAAYTATVQARIHDSLELAARLAGATFTADVGLDDGVGQSPAMKWIDADNQYFQIVKYDVGRAALLNTEAQIDFVCNGDVDDYLRMSTASNIFTIETIAAGDGDLAILAGGGDISFGDENLSTTGALSVTGNISTDGTVDGVDISTFAATLDDDVEVQTEAEAGDTANVVRGEIGDTTNARMTKAVTGNTETGIAVTYNSDDSTYDFVITQVADVDTAGTDIAAALADRANIHDTLTRSFVIITPITAHDFPFWMTPKAITIIAASGVCIAGTNVVGVLMEYDNDAANAVVCNSSDWTFTTGEERTTSVSNASIDAGDWLGWKTESVSGEVTTFTLTFEYTVN